MADGVETRMKSEANEIFTLSSRTESLPSQGRMSVSHLDDSRDLGSSRTRVDIDPALLCENVVVSKTTLGKGSFAAVYDGRMSDTDVIVKKVHDALLTSPSDRVKEFTKSVERHWHILGKLEHSRIASYMGVCLPEAHDFTASLTALHLADEVQQDQTSWTSFDCCIVSLSLIKTLTVTQTTHRWSL